MPRMSEDTLNLILQRLDGMEHEQRRRFEKIDQRFEKIDQRFEKIDQRFERVEREQTRLRTDLVNQMERVLSTMQLVREDVTVAMAYAARADSATDATATIQRSLQSQLGQLRSRVERLEGKRDDAE
jgi:predicted  nucleic acid-binding Zn-ribbon protein